MKKSILVSIIFLLLCTAILFNGCSSKSAITGKWVYETENIEFFEDNTYRINSGEADIETGIYLTTENQLTFDSNYDASHICEFKIKGNKLTLTYENQTITFIKE